MTGAETADGEQAAIRALEDALGEGALANQHILLTGATGFVGQALLEKLLAEYPSTRISVLIRPRGSLTGRKRLTSLMRKPVFKPWRERVGAEEADRQVLRDAGFSDRDIWDIANIAGFYNMTNRVASAVDMQPNPEYHNHCR